MKRKRKKIRKEADRELLDLTFAAEAEWRRLRHIVDHMVEPTIESRMQLRLAEAKYMFLLKEVKHRNISALRY